MMYLSFQLDLYADIDDETVISVPEERVCRRRAYQQSTMGREMAAMVLPCTAVHKNSNWKE